MTATNVLRTERLNNHKMVMPRTKNMQKNSFLLKCKCLINRESGSVVAVVVVVSGKCGCVN